MSFDFVDGWWMGFVDGWWMVAGFLWLMNGGSGGGGGVVVVVVGVVVVVANGRGGCGWCYECFLGSGLYYFIV